MIGDFLRGAGFLVRGFDLVRQPGWRRYAALPVLVSLLVYVGLIIAASWGFETWIAALLPSGWGWLEWLLWPLFALAVGLFLLYTFIHLTNLIAAPFNDFLAERVWRHARGEAPPEGGWLDVLRQGWLAVAGTAAVLLYSLRWAAPLFLLAFVPGVNLAVPFLWLVFNAWMLALEYADYPLGVWGVAFRERRAVLARHRALGLGFGAATLVVTAVPVVNLLAMPAAVAGATLMLVERGEA